jgi:tetratricopeptide (TPR) repeat protein
MARAWLLLGVALLSSGCGEPKNDPAKGPADQVSKWPDPAPVQFSDDDFEAALARAKKGRQLLFVDAWAPWCHTCLSMREVVLERPELGRFQRDFTFVAVDTDRPENAAFVERYHMRVWPTFFVIDPATGGVLGAYGGSLSLDEMVAFLERSQKARGSADVGSQKLFLAHAAYRERRFAEAAALYEEAAGSVANDHRAEPLSGGIRAYWEAEVYPSCVRFGTAHLDAVTGSSAPSDFALTLRECAKKLPASDDKLAALEKAAAKLAALAAAPPPGASVDDRADTFAALAEIAREAKDDEKARELEGKRLALLEADVAKATSVKEAQVHDYERMLALIALGRGEEAVTLLTARTKEMPDNYEPFARLGSALLEVGRPKDAVAALDRAIALSYGPRRTRYLAQKAKAQGLAGDRVGSIATLELEVAALRELPAAQQDAKRMRDAETRLEAARSGKDAVKSPQKK